MKGKRGMEVGQLMVLIIAVVVLLIVVGVLIFGKGGDLKRSLENLIPGFEQTEQKVEGLEIIGYNIPEGKIEYYDGTTWIELKSGQNLELNEKRVEESEFRREIGERYYFYVPLKEGETIIKNAYINSYYFDAKEKRITDDTPTLDAKIVSNVIQKGDELYKIGDVVLSLIESGEKTPYTSDSLLLDYDGNLYWSFGAEKRGDLVEAKEGVSAGGFFRNVREEIFSKTAEWRDSVLKKPVEISYRDSDEKKDKSGWYCVKKNKGRIYVELDKEVSSSEVCA